MSGRVALRRVKGNIGERISELTSQFHQLRQVAITEELVDIAAGFEESDAETSQAEQLMHDRPREVRGPPDRGPAQYSRRRRTIRLQLLMVVNSVLAVFVAIFLVFDYRRDLGERVEEKRIALEEEAKTLLPAVERMQHQGGESVQRYIDAVCKRMQDDHSPGHHIAVQVENDNFQATAHHRASPQILKAMQRAADSPSKRTPHGPSELLVGTYSHGDATVYVSETMENLHRSVIGDVLHRLTGFVVLAFVAVVVVNIALSRIVTRPLNMLVTTVQRIGKGELGIQSDSFHSSELNYLAGEINSMSEALAEAERACSMQMAKAREIQQNLLPKSRDIPGLRVAHLFEPADDVGGDYYDTLPLGDGTWLFCVADVTGHGVPAALSAAMLKALLIQAADQSSSPAAMLEFINRRFAAVSLDGDFVSMLIVQASVGARTIDYASAGHEPAWLLSPTGAKQELSSTGILLGIKEDAMWDDTKLDVSPGDRLVMVTDGASETHNVHGKMFGRSRLAKLVANCRESPLEESVERITESLASYRGDKPQHDDVTVVLVEFT